MQKFSSPHSFWGSNWSKQGPLTQKRGELNPQDVGEARSQDDICVSGEEYNKSNLKKVKTSLGETLELNCW